VFTDRLFTLCTTLTLAAAAYGQATKAELLGVVRDPSGRPVPSVVVELRNNGMGLATVGLSAGDGGYQFLALPTGVYRLTAVKDGFPPLVRDGISLRVGDRVELNLELRLGDSSQVVEVTAAAPLLQAGRGTEGIVWGRNRWLRCPWTAATSSR
jgi:hypothetical protein